MGKDIELDTMDECESVKNYGDYVKNRAIITILENKKIILKTNKDGWSGAPKFVLLKTDLNELREIIYGKGESSHDDAFFEEKYNEGKLHNLFRTAW